MRRRDFLRSVGLAAGATMASWRTRGQSAPSRANILFITTDDMNCDSVGVFGCKVPDTTPNIDGLARQGFASPTPTSRWPTACHPAT